MFSLTANGNRFVAAFASLAISAIFMATAIVPASPALGVIA